MEAGSPIPFFFAGVAELADAPDLGSGVPDVQVQVLSPAPDRAVFGLLFFYFYFIKNRDRYLQFSDCSFLFCKQKDCPKAVLLVLIYFVAQRLFWLLHSSFHWQPPQMVCRRPLDKIRSSTCAVNAPKESTAPSCKPQTCSTPLS